MKKLTVIIMMLLLPFFVFNKTINAGISESNLPSVNGPYALNPFELMDDQDESDLIMQGVKNVYPFPAKEYITIDGIDSGRMEILNFQGTVLKTITIDCPVAVIGISDLPKGVYHVRILTESGTELLKLTKE